MKTTTTKLSATLPCVKSPISRTSGTIRGDVSGKRFSMHAMERNVAGVA